MKDIIFLCLLAFVAGASAQCSCPSMKWALCDGNPCTCTVRVGLGSVANAMKQQLDCTKLIPKCFLMKTEMFRARNNMSTRSIGGKPVETAVVDNDGIYDPECENDGKFKAIQCNNTETCWCVNSAGVRRSDKGDKNIKCESAETIWIRLELLHKPVTQTMTSDQLKTELSRLFSSRYFLPESYVKEVQYDAAARLIVMDVKKADGKDLQDLPRMAYYLEKDVKSLPLFVDQNPFAVSVNNNRVEMEKIVVYYVDDKAPTFTMQKLTGGVIAVIVVVILVVLIGLLVLLLMRKREQAKYSKAQGREMETMS